MPGVSPNKNENRSRRYSIPLGGFGIDTNSHFGLSSTRPTPNNYRMSLPVQEPTHQIRTVTTRLVAHQSLLLQPDTSGQLPRTALPSKSIFHMPVSSPENATDMRDLTHCVQTPRSLVPLLTCVTYGDIWKGVVLDVYVARSSCARMNGPVMRRGCCYIRCLVPLVACTSMWLMSWPMALRVFSIASRISDLPV